MRSSWRADRVLGWMLPILAILAEGALLAVVYVAIETAVDHRVPLLGPFEIAAATGIAAFLVHRGWLNPDEDWLRFLALLGGLGLVGWMWDADVRALVLAGDPVAALPLHPGGWLLVVAAMRGVGRGVDVDDRAMTRLVIVGVPALAVPWVIGQIGSGDLRDVFTEHAFVASLSFVTTGFMAAGLARLREIGRETGVDWRRNRSWLGTVFGVLLVVLGLGIPASILFGLPGDAVARGILGPIVIVLSYVIAAGLAAAALVAALLARGLKQLGLELPLNPPDEQNPFLQRGAEPYTIDEIAPLLTGVIAVWIVIVIVLIVLARVWLRQRSRGRTVGSTEERSIRLPQRSRRARASPRAAVRAMGPIRPHDAVTAYLASLQDLAGHDAAAARGEHETPRRHARRIEASAELRTLQADYSLARYGGRSLTDAENRRGLERWRRLRGRLG